MTGVLIVEDDPQLLRALRINLTARRYDVYTASDGATALTLASRHRPDLLILDLGLPDLDGVTVIEGLRGWYTGPIIVLSARHTEAAKVAALDAGADDYVTKPFGMDELLARLRTALRRAAAGEENAPAVTTDAFTIDLTAKRATRAGTDVRLTPTERHILEILVRHPDKLISHKHLLTEIWGPRYEKRDQLPTRPYREPPTQTRTHAEQTALPDHRTRYRVPIHPVTEPGEPGPSDGSGGITSPCQKVHW